MGDVPSSMLVIFRAEPCSPDPCFHGSGYFGSQEMLSIQCLLALFIGWCQYKMLLQVHVAFSCYCRMCLSIYNHYCILLIIVHISWYWTLLQFSSFSTRCSYKVFASILVSCTLQRNKFYHLGMLMAMSFVQDGSGFFFLAPPVYQYMSSKAVLTDNHVNGGVVEIKSGGLI